MSRRPLTPTHGHLDDHAHDSARRRNPQADARDRDGERHGSQLRPSGADALVRSICRETNLNILAPHKMPDASLARCRIGHSLRRLVLASLFRLAINNREVLTPHGKGEFPLQIRGLRTRSRLALRLPGPNPANFTGNRLTESF